MKTLQVGMEITIRLSKIHGIFGGRISKIGFNNIDCILFAGPDKFNQEIKNVPLTNIIEAVEVGKHETKQGTNKDDS